MQNNTKICKTDFELFLKLFLAILGKKLHFPIIRHECLIKAIYEFLKLWGGGGGGGGMGKGSYG